MYFKFDYDKVSEIGNTLVSKTEELNSLYLELIDICKKIDDNWQSEDSTIYLNQFATFILNQIKETDKLTNAGLVLKKISSRYEEQDYKWAKDLMKNDTLKGIIDKHE